MKLLNFKYKIKAKRGVYKRSANRAVNRIDLTRLIRYGRNKILIIELKWLKWLSLIKLPIMRIFF
jgi:hypothetical protein